jgi:predicted nuclease of predicted toxin-antitoxin system
LRLLVDEDTQAKTLVRLLRDAGHDVVTVEMSGLTSVADSGVLSYAIRESRVLLTRNCGDFLALSRVVGSHAGILAIYQDADPSKNMSYTDIVRAIRNLEESEVLIEGEFVVLNAWRW